MDIDSTMKDWQCLSSCYFSQTLRYWEPDSK